MSKLSRFSLFVRSGLIAVAFELETVTPGDGVRPNPLLLLPLLLLVLLLLVLLVVLVLLLVLLHVLLHVHLVLPSRPGRYPRRRCPGVRMRRRLP